MKKNYALLLLVLVALSGCGRKRKKMQTYQSPTKEVTTEIDIPVAAEQNIQSFFDEDLGEFALVDDAGQKNQPVAQKEATDDVSWMEEATAKEETFKIVYFDFDSFQIRADQESTLHYNVAAAKQAIEKNLQEGRQAPVIVIDGHACHSAGSHIYNLALSEKRAKILADRLIAEGIPSECIKVVGRGMEMPAIINGQTVDGSREQQWPNRRDELKILFS